MGVWRLTERRKKHSVLPILDNYKGFINLRFMHKLYWIKTEWNRLDSLDWYNGFDQNVHLLKKKGTKSKF